jgi:hypothetical protein
MAQPTTSPSSFTLSEIIDELQAHLQQCRTEVRDAEQWARGNLTETEWMENAVYIQVFQARIQATLRCFEDLHRAEAALAAQLIDAWQQDADEAVREIGEALADGSGLRI